MTADDALARSDRGRQTALGLVDDLDLVRRWSRVGRVVLVGAMAYDLVYSRDIDFEVFTSGTPEVRDGFRVLAELAEHPRVTKVRFTNALSSPDQGLYWQLRCRDDVGEEWKVDLWTLDERHPGPLAARLVEPLRASLDDTARRRILVLKEARAAGETGLVASIDIYRAVIDGGVATAAELAEFLGPDYTPSLSSWLPA